MSQNRIFREELPGEKKSIITLLMTGYFVAISCMGYMAFYIFIQLAQMDRIIFAMDHDAFTAEQFDLLKNRVLHASGQLRGEIIGLAVVGGIVAVIGGIYTYNLVVRPLEKLIEYAQNGKNASLPEIKSNNEIKQLATAITHLASRQGNKNGD
ncbi:MAG: hypothetical protein ACE5GQ_09880 [Nitrospinales bacterium]